MTRTALVRIRDLALPAVATIPVRLGWLLQPLRWIIPAVLVFYICRQFLRLDVAHVWESKPTSILFYGALGLSFFVQPLADLTIYRCLWGVGRRLPLSLLLQKRFLNLFLLDYSGEAYLMAHATRDLKLPRSLVVHSVKDANILSAGAGLVTLTGLSLSGGAQSLLDLQSAPFSQAWLALVPVALCGVLVLARRQMTALSFGQLAVVFAIQMTRSIAALAIECLIWWLSGALQDATTCIAFVTLRLLVSRLPLIPSKDLIFLGLGLKVLDGAGMSAAAVAAVLVLLPASHYLLNLALVGLPWLALRPRVALESVGASVGTS